MHENNENTIQDTPVKSEKIAGQRKAATKPLNRQLEKLYDLMQDLRQDRKVLRVTNK